MFDVCNWRLALKHLDLKEILVVKGRSKVTLKASRKGIPHETRKQIINTYMVFHVQVARITVKNV